MIFVAFTIVFNTEQSLSVSEYIFNQVVMRLYIERLSAHRVIIQNPLTEVIVTKGSPSLMTRLVCSILITNDWTRIARGDIKQNITMKEYGTRCRHCQGGVSDELFDDATPK